MSISKLNSLTIEYITDINSSDYEFKRFGVATFKGLISVNKLTIASACFSQWKGASTTIFNSIKEELSSSEKEVYCFMVSPAWKKDTRIVRHFGLSKALSKDYEVTPLNLVFETVIASGGYVIFCGVAKLTSANNTDIFNLLSTYENGILFSSINSKNTSFSSLIEKLTKLIGTKPISSSFNLDIVKAIELITSEGEKALYPYAWEETGEYHMDIFDVVERQS